MSKEKNDNENVSGSIEEQSEESQSDNSQSKEDNQSTSRKRKKTRRGKPIQNQLKKFSLFYSNCRGLKSKSRSIRDIIDEKEPTIICLVETHLQEKEQVDKEVIEGYEPFTINHTSDSGGIFIGVKKTLRNVTTEVHRYKEMGQSLWITIDNGKVNLRIGVIYAPQETNTRKNQLNLMYKDIEKQISIANSNNQKLLLLGDFNCKVGSIINNNNAKVSVGGRLLLKLASKKELTILNSTDLCNGLWTRIEKEKKSVIDYIITRSKDVPNIISMEIDEEREYPVYRTIKEKNESRKVYSDHNSMFLSSNWLQESNINPLSYSISVKGYKDFRKKIQERNVSKLLSGSNYQEQFDSWTKEIEWIAKSVEKKKKCKGRNIKKWIKVKRGLRSSLKGKQSKDTIKLLKRRLKLIDEHIEEEEKLNHANKIRGIVQKLRINGGVNGPNMWKVRDAIKSKKGETPTAVADEKGNLLEKREDILKRYQQYFHELLTKKEAEDEEEQKIEEEVNIRFEDILAKAKHSKPPEISAEEVDKAVKKNKRRKARDRQGWRGEWLLEGGAEMRKSLVILYNQIQYNSWIPEQWNMIRIKALHKKGPKKDLENKRGIFLANILYKTFERIIIARNEAQIERMLSNHQCGARKGLSTADNLMVVSAMIERNRCLGRNTYIFFADAVKCFDKLWLKNCLLNMNKAGFPLYDTALLYHLNHKATISVDTPSGETDDFTVYDVVKQGTISGPLICCAEVDQINKVNEIVAVPYGPEVMIGMPEYVDDVSTVGEGQDIRNGIRNCREMEKFKFSYGLIKTKYMIIHTGKDTPEIIDEQVKQGSVEETKEYPYVGLWINQNGNLSSHIQCIKQKVKSSLTELMNTGHESKVGMEAIRVKLKLYSSTTIHAMVYRLEVWEGTTPKEYQEFERIQANCLRKILNLPCSTPYIGILMETGFWPVEQYVWYRKLMLYHNIIHSKDTRLSKIIWQQQYKYNMPHSFNSNVQILGKYLEVNCHPSHVALVLKSQWKKLVKESINKYTLEKFQPMLQSMTKVRFLKRDQLERKLYVEKCSSYLTQKIMLVRLNMNKTKENFRGKQDNSKCRLCSKDKETTEHLLGCSAMGTNTIDTTYLNQVDDIQMWKEIVDRVERFERAIDELECDENTEQREEDLQMQQ